MHSQLKNEMEILKKRRDGFLRELENCPKGKFICAKNGNSYKWWMRSGRDLIYIPKSDREKAEALALRRFYEDQIEYLNKEIGAIEMYLRHSPVNNTFLEKKYFSNAGISELIRPYFSPLDEKLEAWQNASFSSNPYHPEKLVHDSVSGHLLRSKSEAKIDTFLFLQKIPFRYECELVLKDGIVYPDFTIRHPKTGFLYYWEHFGRMDDPEYAYKVGMKIERYSDNGIYPDVNLICTYETRENPLRAVIIQEKFDLFLS